MRKSILLVQDTIDEDRLLTPALREAGAEEIVQVVHTGQQAVNYLAGTGEYRDHEAYPLPALVLLDFDLPQVPGLDVLRWVRAQEDFRNISVVMLRSPDNDADMERAYFLGANSFLSKPTNPAELPDVIHSVVDYWVKRNVSGEPQNP